MAASTILYKAYKWKLNDVRNEVKKVVRKKTCCNINKIQSRFMHTLELKLRQYR